VTSAINVFNEQPLHAALKRWYAGDDGAIEVPLAGYIVDVVRDDLLIEIQTGNFSSIKRKLYDLTESYTVVLAFPIPQEKWLVKQAEDGVSELERRKSPKRGSLLGLYPELVSFPALLKRETFSLEVVFTQEEELRHRDAQRGWRRHGWVIDERRLLDVVACRRFDHPSDFNGVLPKGLPDRFTTSDLAKALGKSRRLAQKMAYCLREMGVIVDVGRKGRSILYERKNGE
jgi:hypothetical protein